MYKQVITHGDKMYKVLDTLQAHNVTDKTGNLHLELVQMFMEYKGGDHVLRQGDVFLICETIPEIEFEPII